MASMNSHIVIYFGAPCGPTQVVAAEVKEKGVELLRISPADLNFHAAPTRIQPNFTLYKSLLPQFIYCAANGGRVLTSESPFCDFPECPLFPLPPINVCFSWSKPLPEETAQELRRVHKAIDTRIRGKPAMFIKDPSVASIKHVLSTNASVVTPTIEDTINIQAFRQLLLIAKIASGFLKTHQYPAFLDEEHADAFEEYVGEVNALHDVEVPLRKDGDEAMESTVSYNAVNDLLPNNLSFSVNLPLDFKDAPITFTPHNLPSGDGLYFPFVYELARFDQKTVPSVIRRYFMHGLGEDAQECHDTFQAILEGWGSIHKSRCGDVLSHLFKVIDIALMTQTRVAPLVQNGNYLGCVLLGAGYQLVVNRRMYKAVNRAELEVAVKKADVHTESLWQIFIRIQFAQDADRITAFKGCKNIFKLREYLESLPIGGLTNKDVILKYASKLNFPENEIWSHTAANIDTALAIISDPLRPLHLSLPSMHYSLLFSNNRRHIIWSAFGPTAPSFRVPGGKVQDLTKPFQVAIVSKNGIQNVASVREVTKIGCAIVPLDLAIRHLDEVFEKREIMNPFANAQVRVSTSNINKEYDGESCRRIVEGLRKATNTVVQVASSSSKRAQDGDSNETAAKKAKKYAF